MFLREWWHRPRSFVGNIEMRDFSKNREWENSGSRRYSKKEEEEWKEE